MASWALSTRRRADADPKQYFGVTISSYANPPPFLYERLVHFDPPPPSSSAESATYQTTAATPATETPAPSSPQSTNTSPSVHAVKPSHDPVVADPPPATEEETASSEPQPSPQPSPRETSSEVNPPPKPSPPPSAKTAPKSWSALFVKPASVTADPPKAESPAPPSTSDAAQKNSGRRVTPPSGRRRTSVSSIPRIDPATLLTNPPLTLLTYPTPLLHPRGLINFGNVCFANSILQVLAYCPPFWRIFIEGLGPIFDEVGQMGSGRSQTALLEATLSFVREFKLASEIDLPQDPLPGEVRSTRRTGKGKTVTVEELRKESFNQDPFVPAFLYDAMKENKRFEMMQQGQQEDAEEFLGLFLDTLHEELVFVTERLEANPTPAFTINPSSKAPRANRKKFGAVNSVEEDEAREVERPLSPMGSQSVLNGVSEGDDGWLEVGKKNKVIATRATKSRESIITKVFGGKVRNVLKMPGAGERSATLEPYQPLQLDIQSESVHSVEDALRHITVPETVSLRSSKGTDVSATKQVFIDTLPPILILHLKRFIFDASAGGVGIIKNHKVIRYKSTLDIPQEALSPAKRSDPPIRYQLFGVVYHHGKHATGGHYTVDVLRQDEAEWIRIDDTVIEPVKEDDVVTLNSAGILNHKAEGVRVNSATGIPDKVAYLLFYKRVLQ